MIMVIELALTNIYTFVGTVLIFSGLATGMMTASYPEISDRPAFYAIAAGTVLLLFGAA